MIKESLVLGAVLGLIAWLVLLFIDKKSKKRFLGSRDVGNVLLGALIAAFFAILAKLAGWLDISPEHWATPVSTILTVFICTVLKELVEALIKKIKN